MSSTTTLVIVALALQSMSCSANVTGPPEIIVDRTACSHCSMFISEPVYAAAYRAHGQTARAFDDIGCMLKALRAETASPAEIWVQDANGAGWLEADRALFVASPHLRTPMSGGILAYADAGAADIAAAAHRGDVKRSVSELMTWKGDAR